MTLNNDHYCERLGEVRRRIREAESRFGRPESAVGLLAVSKKQPAAAIRRLFGCGQKAFGESYIQEALEKRQALADLPIEWHFIGPIQSNKTGAIAANFAWVHSVDRLKIAERLDAQRPPELPPLNICLQINISAETTKSGIAVDQAEPLARAMLALPNIRLRGLMAIPAPARNPADQRAPFHALKEVETALEAAGIPLGTLSMGMSDDLEAAVAEGSTLVRVGTALFGSRT